MNITYIPSEGLVLTAETPVLLSLPQLSGEERWVGPIAPEDSLVASDERMNEHDLEVPVEKAGKLQPTLWDDGTVTTLSSRRHMCRTEEGWWVALPAKRESRLAVDLAAHGATLRGLIGQEATKASLLRRVRDGRQAWRELAAMPDLVLTMKSGGMNGGEWMFGISRHLAPFSGESRGWRGIGQTKHVRSIMPMVTLDHHAEIITVTLAGGEVLVLRERSVVTSGEYTFSLNSSTTL